MNQLFSKLKEVQSFGGIDASADRILLAAFEDHSAYKNALNLSRPIIIGRKGSGKSAIFMKITADMRQRVHALGFTFSDYPWEHHLKQKQSEVPLEECYRESWKYFIALMLCTLLLKNRDVVPNREESRDALLDIERFVRDSYGSTDPSLTRLFTPGQNIQLSGRLNFWAASGEAKTIPVEHLPRFYSEVNRNVIDAIIKCLPRDHKFYVCFDKLDIGFDPTNKDYLLRLVGLIRAAKFANDRMRQADIQGGVVILLRDDIWHILRFEDKNKLTQDQVSEIRWSKNDGPHCIKRLMERRFSEVIGTNISWDALFNEKRQMARFNSKYDFICERGFLRPRDMIQYCNEVLRRFHEKPAEAGFDNELVLAAEEPYSRCFMQELEDELHKHSKSYESYFEVLKGLSTVGFSREEFDRAWDKRKTIFDSGETPQRALESLFEFSVIGYLATGGRAAGSKYIWHYLEPRVRFNGDAKYYQVHLGLKHEFDLKLYARTKK